MLLTVDGVTKRYRGGVVANDALSLEVDRGEVFGLLGHNGAGKTTLVNQLVGLLKPDAGRIRIGEMDAVAEPARARQACSLQPQAHLPLTGLTPRKAIELAGRLRGGRRGAVRRRTAELLARLRLEAWADTSAHRLSGGVIRLVAFCMAAVEPGRLVVLDEPTNDVDPIRRRLLWTEVRALARRGSAVLLVTHNVAEAERAVDRLAILDAGRLVAQGSPAGLKAPVADELRLEVVWEPNALPSAPPVAAGTALATGRRSRFTIPAGALDTVVAWAQGRRAAGAVEEFSLGPATLEDVYVDLVGRLNDDPNNGADDATDVA